MLLDYIILFVALYMGYFVSRRIYEHAFCSVDRHIPPSYRSRKQYSALRRISDGKYELIGRRRKMGTNRCADVGYLRYLPPIDGYDGFFTEKEALDYLTSGSCPIYDHHPNERVSDYYEI